MATFRVGQRVRVIGATNHKELIGLEGRIAPHGDDPPVVGWYNVTLGIPNSGGYDSFDYPGWQFAPEHLAPITDPGADAFIKRIKKLGKEPINEATWEGER